MVWENATKHLCFRPESLLVGEHHSMVSCLANFSSLRNTGFLRYWTLSNVPLFLLAAPILSVMLKSGFDTIRQCSSRATGITTGITTATVAPRYTRMIIALALAQLVLAVLALTSYHVQIINRISSGYPVWYWWVAQRLCDEGNPRLGKGIVTFMVMYGMIQGVLFASFLPPA
jgi:GPI mannosyltransferase 2